jgi:hypothetical protein
VDAGACQCLSQRLGRAVLTGTRALEEHPVQSSNLVSIDSAQPQDRRVLRNLTLYEIVQEYVSNLHFIANLVCKAIEEPST